MFGYVDVDDKGGDEDDDGDGDGDNDDDGMMDAPRFCSCFMCLCLTRLSLREKARLHTSHEKGLSLLCVRLCLKKLLLRANLRAQTSQLNLSAMTLCVCWCPVKLLLVMNRRLQPSKSQANGLLTLCVFLCRARVPPL
jgi:hypothetical protein